MHDASNKPLCCGLYQSDIQGSESIVILCPILNSLYHLNDGICSSTDAVWQLLQQTIHFPTYMLYWKNNIEVNFWKECMQVKWIVSESAVL